MTDTVIHDYNLEMRLCLQSYNKLIHWLIKLVAENEQLKRKLKKMKQQNTELLRQINDYREKQRMDAMMKQFVTTRKQVT